MNEGEAPGGPVQPSRVERGKHTQRTRRVVVGAVAAIAVAAVGASIVGRGDPEVPTSAIGGAGDPQTPTPSTLLALQVDGGPAPLLAIVGLPSDSDPFFMPLSAELSVVVPGQGETSTAGISALTGDSMRVALSNIAGVWIDHFAVLSLRDLEAAIDTTGGLAVNLVDAYPTIADVLGPGEITMSGRQVKAFLAGATDDSGVRWEIVLGAMLDDPPSALVTNERADTDAAEAVNATMTGARGAEVLDMPTKRVTATIVLPEYATLDGLLSDTLGSPMPVSTIVLNGSGQPGIGEAIAVRIIPEGFRVVLTKNAESVDVDETEVFTNGTDHEDEARVIKEALGVGRVRVALPSNVGDITIVVGRDFTA